MIDFHNHLMPGVDDGAGDLEQSRAALEAYRAQGFTAVITTPHARGSDTTDPARLARVLAKLDAAWEELRAMAAAEFPEIRLERGVELMLDTPAPELSEAGLRLAGTRFVLVEFPFMAVPPQAGQVLFDLAMRGWTPILAHPERYSNLDPALEGPREWVQRGTFLQVNAGSLLGRYGAPARTAAWGLLEQGLAHYLSSDFHARGTLHAADCRAELERRGAALQARLLLEENPARLLAGQPPEPVPPLARSGGGGFLRRLFGGR